MDDSDKKMTLQNNGFYHKAYFNHPQEMDDELLGVKNRADIDCDDEELFMYSDASIFKMGSCQLFSLALYIVFGLVYGYVPVLMNDKIVSNEQEQGIIHAFCVAKYKGQMAYIDVRGVSTCKDEFLNPYTRGKKMQYTLQRIDDYLPCLSESEKVGFEFAKQIIEDNKEYYSLE